MKTRHSRPASVAVATLSALFAASSVWAGGGFNVGTDLGIRAPDSVNSGHSFVIKGRLKSSKPFCKANSTIKLVKKGSGVIDTDQTNAEGNYRFETSISATRRFKTKFDGKTGGVHPDIKTCRASESKIVKVIAT